MQMSKSHDKLVTGAQRAAGNCAQLMPLAHYYHTIQYYHSSYVSYGLFADL